MSSYFQKLRYLAILVPSFVLAAGPLLPLPAVAADSGSLYTFDFTNGQAGLTNQAAGNAGAILTLQGNGWSSDPTGITFTGNTSTTSPLQSNAEYRPVGGGTTISIPSTQSVAFGALFTYTADQCPLTRDSANLTQIGKDSDNIGQLKLQFHDCSSTGKIFPECRVAGVNTLHGQRPEVTSKMPMVVGDTYRVECLKGPDVVSGNSKTAQYEIITTQIDRSGNVLSRLDVSSAVNSVATGAITSNDYLSVGQKNALPAPSQNTDQFNGKVTKVSYCSGVTLSAAQSCLESEVPTRLQPSAK